jgi:hypothetical protein
VINLIFEFGEMTAGLAHVDTTVVARCFSRSKGKVAAENYGVRGAAGARHAVQKVEGKVGK